MCNVHRLVLKVAMAWVFMLSGADAWALKCDVDNNGRIDKVDVGLIQQAIVHKLPVSGPDDPRDADNSNSITATDTRACTLRCKYSACATNGAPVARTGTDVTVSVGQAVGLSAVNSSDPDGDVLTYAWTITRRPEGSSATLSSTGALAPIFTADRAGGYVIQLIVDDGRGLSAAALMTLTAVANAPNGVVIVSPVDAAVLPADERQLVSATFVDNGGGINVASVIVELDGQDVTAAATVSATGVTYSPSQALPEGIHTLRVAVSDSSGTEAVGIAKFTTASPPMVSNRSPVDTFLPGGSLPVISATLSDVGAGVDTSTVRLLINGSDVTASAEITGSSIRYQIPAPLDDATHQVHVKLKDRAGNATESVWSFATATAPEILAVSPRDQSFPAGASPTITATYRDARIGVDRSAVRLYVNGVDVSSSATITESQISYTPSAPLPEGSVTVYLDVVNRANGIASSTWGFEMSSPSSYLVTLVSPGAGLTTTSPRLRVVATAQASRTSVETVSVNGRPMSPTQLADGPMQYVADVDLVDGNNKVAVVATFADGESRNASSTVAYDAPPRVTITAPSDRLTLGAVNSTSPRDLTGTVDRPVTITGRVSKPVTSVTINQQQAEVSGQDFRFDNFFLHEGVNHLKVTATDSSGRVGTSAITVSVDQTAPILTVEQPVGGLVTSSNTVDIRGLANDAVEGMAGAPEPTVTVLNGANGANFRAQVADRYYLASGVPLAVGENTLTLTAADQAGNTRTVSLKVTRVTAGSDRIAFASGRVQQGSMHIELAQPLAVTALSRAGEPLAGVPVSFDVMRGTGWISTVQGQIQKPDGINPARNIVVMTNAQGQAGVWFTPGKQSGAGAHAVRAWVNVAALPAGAAGSTIADELSFYATTARGLPAHVLSDMGTAQFAEVRGQPLELLSAVVRDEFNNLLPGLPVTFRIDAGDAHFVLPNGERSADNGRVLTVITDKNGFAAVRPTLGETPGLVRVLATTLADPANASAGEVGGAAYVIQVLAPQDGPAAFTGRIFTDKNKPLPGVRVSIGRTSLSSTTDDQGHFRLDDVPPGRVDLFIDGRTSNFESQVWPSLHFEATAVQGRENTLSHPIYLPPLAMAGAKIVGGAEDVILKIGGLDGFQMKVKANSVTFPDGSKVGTLVVSPVVADRLPMSPPAGAANFGIPAWTIQPAGTRFDPPIEVTMPNSRAMRPGETVPVVQWDHDLAQFVPMGHATVSEDAAVLVTDAGSGVTKAGWGGACVYDPDNCGKNARPDCNECEKLNGAKCPSCEPDAAKDGRRTAQMAGQVAFESDINMRRNVRFIFNNLGVIVEPKLSGILAYTTELICCFKRRGASKVEASGAAQVEVAAIIPLMPVLQKFASFLFEDAVSGPAILGKLNVSGSGNVNYDQCTGAGGGGVKLTGGAEAALSVGGGEFKYTQRQMNGAIVEQRGDLRPLDAGMVGTMDYGYSQVTPAGLKGGGSAFISLFVKSSISIGSFNWTVLDLSVPVFQGQLPDSVLPIPGL